MKKFLTLITTILLLLSVCACRSDSSADQNNTTATQSAESTSSGTTSNKEEIPNETTSSKEDTPTETTPIKEDIPTETAPSQEETPTETTPSKEDAPHTHSWTAATCTTAKTCSTCKATEGSAKGHSWTAATCTTAKTCSACKATEGSAKGHSWKAATCTTAKTCSTCKATEGSAKGHSWTAATCTSAKTCSACGATEGQKLNHNYIDGVCTLCKANDPYYVKYYSVGEKWVVAGQWEFTINSVQVHRLCNSYTNSKYGYTNQQVIVINYTYKNIGYNGSMGLYIPNSELYVYDEKGSTAKGYACTHTNYPGECVYGTQHTCSGAYVLSNNSKYITVYISLLQGKNGNLSGPEQSAYFKLQVK